MSSNPRNPTYFPRMKARGARRRMIAPWQRVTGSFLRLNTATVEAANTMKRFAQLVIDGGDAA